MKSIKFHCSFFVCVKTLPGYYLETIANDGSRWKSLEITGKTGNSKGTQPYIKIKPEIKIWNNQKKKYSKNSLDITNVFGWKIRNLKLMLMVIIKFNFYRLTQAGRQTHRSNVCFSIKIFLFKI